jgi:signal transduction histidine kinase
LAAAGTGDGCPRLPRTGDPEMDGQGDARSRRSSENVWMSWVSVANRVSLVDDGQGRLAGGQRRIAAARYQPFVASVALTGFAVVEALFSTVIRYSPADPGRATALLVVALITVFTTLPLAALWTHPAAAAVAIAAANLLSLVGFQVLTVPGLIALLAALYRLGNSGSRILPAVLASPFLVAALSLAVNPTGAGGSRNDFQLRGLTILAASLGPAAAWAGAARRSRAEAVQHSATQQEIAGTLLEHTARGERARISRELHDVVAHHISMIAVQAETARLATPGMPAAGAQRLSAIGDTARSALTEMRRLLGVLREDTETVTADRKPQPGLQQLNELLDEAREAAGTGARLIVRGVLTALDPGVELAAYRIVQEALTNARRHAPGAAVDVELHYAGSELRLRIRDNGPGPPIGPSTPGPEHGHGLLGMRERAAAVGGELRTAAAPGGGFLVEAWLPAKADAAA